jgi:hypothetical protein
MKKLILLGSFIVLALPAIGQNLLRSNVTLYWDYPVSTTNVTFVIKGSPVITTPLSNWTVKGVVMGNPSAPSPTNITIALDPQEFFFVCQASNFWGLSNPSNVASTPPPPRSDVSLGVR